MPRDETQPATEHPQMTEMTAQDVLARYLEEALPDFADLPSLDVNQRGRFESCPLHIAATRGSAEEVQALLRGGADVRAVGDMGNLALHDAIDAGSLPAVQLLLDAGSPLDVSNEFGQTPLALGLASDDEAIRRLFEAQAARAGG
ncbi:MAG: ankyrin repeat domain-containing protein [Aquabacterium sp.]|uniref:ankyrin repeat domain-containing protein n=1 Tax=Aquabacterium sp. TaxID=1872578 RepID=UPI0025C61F8C|nr:ankyrin repeat domain-containing protein [Aquabacterium sp.]MBI3380495.1 ankyrin repeat domain-containing protein [Aquabacterium sp.]